MVDLATTQKRYVNVTEVMEYLGYSRRTIYYWIESGKLIAVNVGGTYRVTVESLRDAIKRQEHRQSPPPMHGNVQSSQHPR